MKLLYVCIWGLAEPVDVLVGEGKHFSVYNGEDSWQATEGITLSRTPLPGYDHLVFWRYKKTIELKCIDEKRLELEAAFCKGCQAISSVSIQATPWGRASDEGVRVSSTCTSCGQELLLEKRQKLGNEESK